MSKLFIFFLVFLVPSVFAQAPPEPPAPPSLPSPANGAEAISLPLIFDWEDVSGAQSYYYQIIGITPETLVTDSTSGEIPQKILDLLEPGKVYQWQVKSCSDAEGSQCGNFSSPPWSFTYLLLPPDNLTFDTRIPVELNWPDVTGAKSYIVDPRLDISQCSWWKILLCQAPPIGFPYTECCPFYLLAEKVIGWLGFGEEYDISCPWTIWNEPTKECVALPVLEKQEDSPFAKSEYIDDTCVFTKNVKYKVGIASCLDDYTEQCGPSKEWGFKVGNQKKDGELFILPEPTPKEPFYDPDHPENIPMIGRNHSLKWSADNCSNYVHIFVYGVDGKEIINEKIPNQETISFSDEHLNELFNKSEDLNKVYDWKLQPCWRVENDILCEAGVFSDKWYFKTIGEPPTLQKPTAGESVKVPKNLEWEPIDGAGSYYYQVANNDAFTEIKKEGSAVNHQIKIDYPDINPGSQYWWRVKTCADDKGKVCGKNWSEDTFRTYPVNPPINLKPATGTMPTFLEWDTDPGAHFYQYMVDYVSTTYDYDEDGNPIKETLEECEGKVGSQIVSPTITPSTNFWLGEICLGEYNWRVRSCLEKNCTEGKTPPIVSGWAKANYIAAEISTPPEKGIVPCGRRTDIRATPYDERESCQLKHAGFLFQNILDFLLWRLGLIILALLAIATGVIFYFSLGSPTTMTQAKSILKSAGMGYGIIFLAWIFINLLLVILGYQVKFFGKWWELSF